MWSAFGEPPEWGLKKASAEVARWPKAAEILFRVAADALGAALTGAGSGRACSYGVWHVTARDRHLHGARARALERVGRGGDAAAAQLRHGRPASRRPGRAAAARPRRHGGSGTAAGADRRAHARR